MLLTEARRRWKMVHPGAAPRLSLCAGLREGCYEIRARSAGAEVEARLSARFWNAYAASGGEACARCTARFFEKLFRTLKATRTRP